MTKQDFLFEIGCEELPPKALKKLAVSLHDSIADSLKNFSLEFKDSEWFATPRRLAVRFSQLDTAQADKQVEKLGPAVKAAFDDEGNARPAATGFARSCGVELPEISRKQTDKGERLAYLAEVKGQSTTRLLPDMLKKAITQLPVPKAMRWGDSNFQFTRPVHWILTLLGEEIVPFELFGLSASDKSYGHRFHAPQAININQPADYEKQLLDAKVITCYEARKAKIRQQVEAIARPINATAVIDENLLEEVTALVEWPVALMGQFDDEFLTVPSEALISSMAEHQKYFHLTDSNQKLLARFVTVSNIESKKPDSVIQGNEKVIRPRLADAKFFYETDCKKSLDSYIEKLQTIVFQNKLGTLFDKTQRVKTLARFIARQLNSDEKLVARAADICKCDLMSDMVGEFSDLQGIMGRYYAQKDGEPDEVADAMDEIYMPRFSGDHLPESTTGLILAIADRVDTLVGIFGIGQIPTGAKDPFALRRAAVGVLRLISEKSLSLDLKDLIDASIDSFSQVQLEEKTKEQLLAFFAARELAHYQSMEIATQVISAVQAIGITSPADFKNRVFAVDRFNQSAESADLAEANKRVKNILQKSDFNSDKTQINQSLFEADESALFETIDNVKDFVNNEINQGNYQQALDRLAELKTVVNNFFDKVMINADDEKIRNNRLALINELRNLFIGIADISLLQK